MKALDKYLLLPFIIYSALLIPFLNIIPYLDGNIDFVKSYDFYSGGLQRYLSNWQSVHPPLKVFVASLFYKIGGFNVVSYNLIGLLFGVIGLTFYYSLSNILFNKSITRIATLFLASSPLYLSVGIFSLIDFLLTVFILASIYFYSKNKYLLYGIFCSFAVLTKDTGLLLPLIVVLVECISFLKNIIINKRFKNIYIFIHLLVPLITYFLWFLILKINNSVLWQEHIFTETADKGAIYTIFKNLIMLRFLNKYTYYHWLHLFIFNFNWVYWLIVCSYLLIIVRKLYNRGAMSLNFITRYKKRKTIIIIALFFLSYLLTVLTFQTYTIPRYVLPLIPFLLLASSVSIYHLTQSHKLTRLVLSGFLSLLVIVQLFFSFDPLSIAIRGKTEILNQTLYSPYGVPVGLDGITYNMQYLFIAKKRTEELLSAKGHVYSNQCSWIFPDLNNDYKTISILKLTNLNKDSPCLFSL